ncbi:hypothetical protein ACB092_05G082800 [Castanea dentata]
MRDSDMRGTERGIQNFHPKKNKRDGGWWRQAWCVVGLVCLSSSSSASGVRFFSGLEIPFFFPFIMCACFPTTLVKSLVRIGFDFFFFFFFMGFCLGLILSAGLIFFWLGKFRSSKAKNWLSLVHFHIWKRLCFLYFK